MDVYQEELTKTKVDWQVITFAVHFLLPPDARLAPSHRFYIRPSKTRMRTITSTSPSPLEG